MRLVQLFIELSTMTVEHSEYIPRRSYAWYEGQKGTACHLAKLLSICHNLASLVSYLGF